MTNQELYEIARAKIEQSKRRWSLWAFNLGFLILAVAGVVLASDTVYQTLAVALMLAIAAVFVPHTIIAVMAESEQEDIEKEVERLREAVYEYEKPKRLHLSNDGELAEANPWEDEQAKRTKD